MSNLRRSRSPRLPQSGPLVLVLALLLAAGCGFRGGLNTKNPFAESYTEDQSVRITVENRNFNDARLIADWNGSREIIGWVGGKSTETFRMEWRDDVMRIQVNFVGGGGYTTYSQSVFPGDHLQLMISSAS